MSNTAVPLSVPLSDTFLKLRVPLVAAAVKGTLMKVNGTPSPAVPVGSPLVV